MVTIEATKTAVRGHRAKTAKGPIVAASVVSIGVGTIATVAATMDTIGTVPTVACLVVSTIAAGDAISDAIRAKRDRNKRA
jgi:hypothetical protein